MLPSHVNDHISKMGAYEQYDVEMTSETIVFYTLLFFNM